MKRNRLTHTRPKDTQTLQISKARQENQASVKGGDAKLSFALRDRLWRVSQFTTKNVGQEVARIIIYQV